MSDELNPDVRKLVDLARQARTPGVADKRRVAERLAVPLAAGAAVGTAAKAVGAQSLFGALGGKLAAVVAVSVVVAAAVVTQRASAPVPRSSASAPLQSASAAPYHAAGESAPSAAAPSVAAPSAPAPSADRAVRPSPPAPSRSPATARELEEEAALLHRAQSAWRAGQSAQALELANQHARRFPRSQLASERDVLRVLSLCQLGQVESARQVGARLLRSAKGSPWYQSVAESCAAP